MGRRVVGASVLLRGWVGLWVPVSSGGWDGPGVAAQGGRSQRKNYWLANPSPSLYIYYITN